MKIGIIHIFLILLFGLVMVVLALNFMAAGLDKQGTLIAGAGIGAEAMAASDSAETTNNGEKSLRSSTAISTTIPSSDSSDSSNSSNSKKKKKTIAYAITVTRDGHFVDGALVLGWSALKVHDASHGYDSIYDAELVAFVAPSVVTARPILQGE